MGRGGRARGGEGWGRERGRGGVRVGRGRGEGDRGWVDSRGGGGKVREVIQLGQDYSFQHIQPTFIVIQVCALLSLWCVSEIVCC